MTGRVPSQGASRGSLDGTAAIGFWWYLSVAVGQAYHATVGGWGHATAIGRDGAQICGRCYVPGAGGLSVHAP
jgi:hypothetical protein